MRMNVPEPIVLAKNVNLYVMPCSIFKTTSINVFIPTELDDDYTYHALIPNVLARGTVSYPDRKAIKRHLQDLYGATVAADVRKYGNKQVMSFGVGVIDDQYIQSEDSLLEQAVEFLRQLIFEPTTENGLFRQDYVVQEAYNLKQQILSIINDKAEYSAMRLNREMNPGKVFTKCVFGDADELDNIDENRLFRVYKSIIATNPVDIFVAGDVDVARVTEIIKNNLVFGDRGSLPEYIPEPVYPTEVKYKQEKMDVKQGKLNIGYRTNMTAQHEDYCKLLMFNEVFGGGLNSKLFMNVREKASLCYTVYSAVDKFNGQLFVYTGIETANYQKAYDIIKEQLQAIIDGDISDFEMEAAVKEYRTRLKAVNDSMAQMVNFCYSNILAGVRISTEEQEQKICSVTKADIVDIAGRIAEDTVFFLTNN